MAGIVEKSIAQLLEETIGLAEAGHWNEIYKEAYRQGIEAFELTEYLWESRVHPETEGLGEIPRRFACTLDAKSVTLGSGVWPSCVSQMRKS